MDRMIVYAALDKKLAEASSNNKSSFDVSFEEVGSDEKLIKSWIAQKSLKGSVSTYWGYFTIELN